MGWTKRELIQQAFDAVGLSSYVFNLTADQYQSAHRMLNTLMALWNARGIRISYLMPSTADGGDLDDQSGIPDAAYMATITNLGMMVAGPFGKTVPLETKIMAKQSYDTLLSWSMGSPRELRPYAMPSGAGSKDINAPFLEVEDDNLLEFLP